MSRSSVPCFSCETHNPRLPPWIAFALITWLVIKKCTVHHSFDVTAAGANDRRNSHIYIVCFSLKANNDRANWSLGNWALYQCFSTCGLGPKLFCPQMINLICNIFSLNSNRDKLNIGQIVKYACCVLIVIVNLSILWSGIPTLYLRRCLGQWRQFRKS